MATFEPFTTAGTHMQQGIPESQKGYGTYLRTVVDPCFLSGFAPFSGKNLSIAMALAGTQSNQMAMKGCDSKGAPVLSSSMA